MASCSSSGQTRLQPRAGETEMAEKIFRWVDGKFLPLKPIWNRRNPQADPVQCGIYRPDFVFERDAGVVIDEYDENGHQKYNLRCELVRQAEVSLGYGGRPVHWIRYNPDYFSMGNQTNFDILTRDDMHLKQLQFAIQNPDYDHFIKVDYLFYAPMFGGEGGMIQSFEFHTIQDYQDWVDTVAPDDQNQRTNGAVAKRYRKFLVSYNSSYEISLPEILRPYAAMKIDECYTLSQRDLKYTLFHNQKRLAKSAVSYIFKDLEKRNGIRCAAVFGYEEISMGDEVDLHPGFKLMVEHMNAKSQFFESWMRNGSLETNARGLLYRYLSPSSVGIFSKSQLLTQFEALRRENEMLRERTSTMETLEFQTREQKNEIEALRSENASLQFQLSLMEIAARPRRKRQEPEASQ